MRAISMLLLAATFCVAADEAIDAFPQRISEAQGTMQASLLAFLQDSDAEALVHRNDVVRERIEALRDEVNAWTALAEAYGEALRATDDPPEPVAPALERLEGTARGGEIITRFLDQFGQMAVVVAETEPLYAGTLFFSDQADADRYNAIATSVQETQGDLLDFVASLAADG